MPGTVAAAVKAANVRFVVPSAVLLAGALWVVGGATVGMVGVPVRSRWFVMLVFAVVAGVPLETRFGVIETCLARPRCFGPRLVLSGSVVAVGYVACLISAPGDGAVRPWFLVVVAVGVMVSALRPAAGWFASLTVGGASILIDHLALTSPVSNAAARLGDGGAGLTLALAGLLYLWWRPRAGALG